MRNTIYETGPESNMNKRLESKYRSAPDKPGVYLMKDGAGRVIYVGKAKSLKKRLPAYLAKELAAKTRSLMKRVAGLELILASSELEALVLEGNLIKKFRPRYNVYWRDDKSFPFLRLSTDEEFPALAVSRQPGVGRARYFGPFVRVRMKEMLALISKYFAVRHCKSFRRYRQGRPCLNYQIKRCLAPCAGKVTQREYAREVERLVLFLTGHNEQLCRELTARMKRDAVAEEYERAARLRDLLAALASFTERQRVVQEKDIDQDVLALAEESRGRCLQVFFVREGKLCGEYHVFFERKIEAADGGLAAFISQFYAGIAYLPPRIICDRVPEDRAGLEKWLTEKRGARLVISAPRSGRARPLLKMAAENAAFHLSRRLSAQLQGKELAGKLRQALSLKEAPGQLEAFDISHTGGDEAVASMVVFRDGQPDKKLYRRYKLKFPADRDDYAMMREVLGRRFRRLVAGEGEIPDLLLVDGGRGHLELASTLLASFGLEKINVIALAKKEEVIYRRGRDSALKLAADSPVLLYLRRVRDEAHRFAQAFHHLRRKKTYKR